MGSRPPSILEIFLFPIVGVVVVESIRTRHNELTLLTVPLFAVLVRLAWASAQMPRPRGSIGWEQFERLAKRSMETEQIAAVFLLVFEVAGVILMSPGAWGLNGWVALVPFYAVYVVFRLLGRSQWIATEAAAPSDLPFVGTAPGQ